MKRLKVLVICGGGVFGAIPAHFLSMLPQEQQTLKDIDVIAGCSIGGILSCAYAVGHTFADVDKCFQQRAKDCFKKRWQAKINPLECPIYDSESLYEVIQDMIGNSLVRDIKKIFPQLTLVVPALNVTTDKPIFFQNITHEFEKLPLKEVAKMTSAAPSKMTMIVKNSSTRIPPRSWLWQAAAADNQAFIRRSRPGKRDCAGAPRRSSRRWSWCGSRCPRWPSRRRFQR